MKDSLRQALLTELKRNGKLTIEQMESVCHREGRKVDNGTRRLREMRDSEHYSYNSHIGEIKNDKGAITAYTYTFNSYETFDRQIKSGQRQLI